MYYDPMLAKLITWGRDRAEAIERMDWALARYVVLGVTTSIPFLRAVINHPEFVAGRLHTQFLEQHRIEPERRDPKFALVAAALALHNGVAASSGLGSTTIPTGPWQSAGAWRAG